MSANHIIFLLLIFGVVVAVTLIGFRLLAPRAVRERAMRLAGTAPGGPDLREGQWVDRVAEAARPLVKLSLPEEGWETSPIRTRFMNAGWRSASAPIVYFAAKTVLALGLPLVVLAFAAPLIAKSETDLLLAFILLCAGIGYYLPNAVLARRIEKRQLEIFESFPDALDLLTVCVEAGLSLDQAIGKVAEEMHIKSRVLSDELNLMLMEMRAGFAKEKALRNLAVRTGVEDIDTLVAMLIQSERFGTSVGASLRVHADTLRTKRRLRAEEAAAKIALKLLFPLIFFIFPTLLLVLLGPAFIQIYRVLLPTMAGGS